MTSHISVVALEGISEQIFFACQKTINRFNRRNNFRGRCCQDIKIVTADLETDTMEVLINAAEIIVIPAHTIDPTTIRESIYLIEMVIEATPKLGY